MNVDVWTYIDTCIGGHLILQWRHNERVGVSNKQPHDCLLKRLYKAQIKGNIKAPRHWPLWWGIHRWPVNSLHKGPVTREIFPFDDVIMNKASPNQMHLGQRIYHGEARNTLYVCITHWGRVTHICVNKITIIGSDNGVSPDRRQAIIWTNAGILLIGPLGTNFSVVWKMSSILSRSQCDNGSHMQGEWMCVVYDAWGLLGLFAWGSRFGVLMLWTCLSVCSSVCGRRWSHP